MVKFVATMQGYLGIFNVLALVTISESNLADTGYCSFPSFLWTPIEGVERHRKWLSNTEFADESDTWRKQKNITVAETTINIHHHISVTCAGDDTNGRKPAHCYWQVLKYRVICLQEEPNGKFRVQREDNGKFQFSCVKFEQRAPGVVQVYSATPKEENEARLCFSTALHREEWPWIDPLVVVWSPCPLSGGFDFRPSFLSAVTMDGCGETWLPARMESECILGEGIHFTFPNGTCNPFNSSTTGFKVQCRAVWTEGRFTFYLLSDTYNTPRYMLRLPVDAVELSSFTSQLYLSAVAPVSGLGRPPGDVLAFTMYMTRTAAGSCFDESDYCKEFAEQGKCTNTAFHQFASHCVKSCGLCDMAPRNTSECFFSEDLDGQWYLFDERGWDSWVVKPQVISSSKLGTFYCKSKHWKKDYYKTLSIYKNGCRPRYSCFELYRSQADLLKFRLSSSSMSDESFSLCTFKDDPLPVGDTVRSQQRKVLLGSPAVWFGLCDLGLSAHVNVSTGPTSYCDGYMTDLNQDTCTLSQHLTLSLNSCPHVPETVLYCEATASLASQTSLLVTQNTSSLVYQCFIVKTSSDAFGAKTLHFDSTRCSTQHILPSSVQGDISKITTFSDIVDHPCMRDVLSQHSLRHRGRSTSGSPTGLHSNPDTGDRRYHQSTTPKLHTHQQGMADNYNNNNQISHTGPASKGCFVWLLLLQFILFSILH